MGFLIKIALFLGIVIIFIPADEAETKKLGGQSISLFDTVGFASAAYSDASGFCQRNPQACTTGGGFVATFEAKARTGARWVYAFLDPASKTTAPEGAPTDAAALPVSTGSLKVGGPVSAQDESERQVTIPRHARADFLPLPPPKRPS
jgi:hypothetical protein